MRSPREISVGNGWYWLAGAGIALLSTWFYVSVINPILPALEWHRTHSPKMQFADFSLDVPLLWRIPKADFQQPNDISIDKVILPGDRLPSSIGLTRPSFWSRGIVDLESKNLMEPLPGWTDTTRLPYRLTSGSMECFYRETRNHLFVMMDCINEETGSTLNLLGSKGDYSKLHDIVK
jgi:hypothetical protein